MSSPARTTSEDPRSSQATDPDPPLTAKADSAAQAGSAVKSQEPPGSGTAPSSALAPGGGGRRRSGFAVGGDGTTLFYEVLGRPQPATSILLCDGLGCDGYVWKYLQWVLAEHYRILHFHYRGHGRTPLPADISRVSITDFAADALTVLDACETERVVLCGHSLGVQVALETWRAAPARVAGLILVCGSYGNPLQTFKGKDTLSDLLPLLRATVSLAGRGQFLVRSDGGSRRVAAACAPEVGQSRTGFDRSPHATRYTKRPSVGVIRFFMGRSPPLRGD